MDFKSYSQDIHYSQFWMSPLLQNPAFAGLNHDLQAIVNYKNQWASVASPYKTFNASFDMKLNNKKLKKGFMAAGIDIFSDKAGDSQMGTTSGNLFFAYHVFLNENSTLGGGLMGGFAQRSLNTSQLQWMNQYDGMAYNASLPSGETFSQSNFIYPDVGAGIIWRYKKGESYISSNTQIKANVGLSIYHPHRPAYSFYSSEERLNMKTVFYGNMLYGIANTNISVVPGYIVYLQGSNKEILFGSLLRYTTKESSKYTGYVKGSAISCGVHYRNKDAVITSFLLEMGQYAIGISYDSNVSQLRSASRGRGGLEISLRFVNPNPFLYSSRARFD
jgi:type IX secretion system PorP/SprF family membrane protein